MKDLEILEFLKIIQSNKSLILEKVSGTVGNTEIVLDKLRFETARSICGNLWNNLSDYHEFKGEYFESWEHYSGDITYPVSGEEVYESLENCWVGEQGELRFSLIDHLVKCYSEQLGRKIS